MSTTDPTTHQAPASGAAPLCDTFATSALGRPDPTRLEVGPGALEELRLAVLEAAQASPELASAIEKGRETDEAIQAGCPPQFHPGAGPEAEAQLAALRTRLGLGELEWLGVAAGSPPELLGLARAIGLPVAEVPGGSDTTGHTDAG